ncbi:MAG: histidine--tRNA ligase [Deltaproteobacteria bacterium]|nr:histidine--tRNA ligase [Deltaproteobacteria bacterium]
MSQKIRAIKGMEDLFEEQSVKIWQRVESEARCLFEAAGFQEIRTPIVEETALFERGVGETTEIVEKEMYTFLDRNDKSLSLRPEGTASVVRAFIEHFTDHQVQEGRFYYIGPMFRYENPQKGRYRQFHQIGLECFGQDHPGLDAEMIFLLDQFLRCLNVHDFELKINSLGSSECRQAYLAALKEYFSEHRFQLGEEDQRRLERNPLRILDSKDPTSQTVIEGAPHLRDFLSEETQTHFLAVQEFLKNLGVPFTVDSRMVRGLDYYEKTVFEFVSTELGAQNSIAGGGRYNRLVKSLGGPVVPAVGFALGMERLTSLLSAEKLGLKNLPKVFFAALDEDSEKYFASKLPEIRQLNAMTMVDWGSTSLKSKMKRAARWGAQWVLLSGESEREKSVVVVRDMESSSQEEVPAHDMIDFLQKKFS